MRPTIPATPRILSVQGHVVSGYCGNKSATFPLQLLEFEVDVVNSAQVSNHTGYKVIKGQVSESKDLDELHIALEGNGLLKLYDCILTGYVVDVSYIESLALLITSIKQERQAIGQQCWYTLDPILGDDGIGYYAPNGSDFVDVYKRCLFPLADIITPNRFEASILSGVEIDPSSGKTLEQALQAIDVFHQEMAIQVVVITSLEIESVKGELTCILSYDPRAKIGTALGCRATHNNGQRIVLTIRVPKHDCHFTGTGDMFTALLSGWLHKTNFDFRESFENTVNTLHEIIEDTYAYYQQVNDGSVQSVELRLVQNRDSVISPGKKIKAEQYEIHSLSAHQPQ